jgi:hypothetical protein
MGTIASIQILRAMDSTDLFSLVSRTGICHRIQLNGIWTNDVYRRFPSPLPAKVTAARTSFSGHFVSLRFGVRLFLVAVTSRTLLLQSIGADVLSFVDEKFTLDETKLLSLTNRNDFLLFSLFPLTCLRRFTFETPERPLSFEFHDLTRKVSIQCENSNSVFLSFPLTFQTTQSPEPELIPTEIEASLEGISTLAGVEECGEEEERIEEGEMNWDLGRTIEGYGRSVCEHCATLAAKQRELHGRYNAVWEGAAELKLESRRQIVREEELRRESQELCLRMQSLIDGIGTLEEMNQLWDTFSAVREEMGETMCDDDSLSDAQLSEYRRAHLFDRLQTLDLFFKRDEVTTVFL